MANQEQMAELNHLFLTEMVNMTLYLCPLVVVTGHGMDITDQSLQTDLNTAVLLRLKKYTDSFAQM